MRIELDCRRPGCDALKRSLPYCKVQERRHRYMASRHPACLGFGKSGGVSTRKMTLSNHEVTA